MSSTDLLLRILLVLAGLGFGTAIAGLFVISVPLGMVLGGCAVAVLSSALVANLPEAGDGRK